MVARSRLNRLIPSMAAALLLAGCGSPEQRAQGYYEQAQALIEKKDDVAARRALVNALKYRTDKIEIWRALAGIDERAKQQNALFQELRRVVELDPNDLAARLKLVRIMIAGGAGEAALNVIRAANEGDKPNAELHALKAILLIRTKDTDGGLREAQRALEIDPKNFDAILIVALKKAQDGDTDGALKLLDTAQTDPENLSRLSQLKLQIYAKKNDLPKAEALLRQMISQYPSQPIYKEELIQVFVAGRRFDEAEKELRLIADHALDNTAAELDLVRFLSGTKGLSAGRQELEARIKKGGDVFDYQIVLAGVETAQGKLNEATGLLQNLVGSANSPARKAIAQVRLAEAYVNAGNVAAAEPLLAEVLKKDSRDTNALRLRATISIDRGQYDSAISDLREALNNQPKSADLLLLMATAYERSGKNELVERQYADALQSSKFDVNVGRRYVDYLQRRGDLPHAEDILTDVIKHNPQNTQLWPLLARLRIERKNWSGAMAIADTIAKNGDDHGLADEIRASVLAGQNKIDESIAALEKAHAAAPDAVQPFVALASSYVRQGKPAKAEALLQGMMTKFPDNAQLLVLMGQTKLAQNKNDDALQAFKAAIAKQPKDPTGYDALYDLYVRQKNYDAAMADVQSGLKELPGSINFRLASANLQILKGDQEGAMTQYESILKDQPNSLLAINNLASLLLDNRTDKESLSQAFALAERLKSSNLPQFADTVGWAQYKQGNYTGAVSILEAALAKQPNLAALRYHLGMSYIATGQADKAADQFKAAFALEPDGTPLKASIRSAMK